MLDSEAGSPLFPNKTLSVASTNNQIVRVDTLTNQEPPKAASIFAAAYGNELRASNSLFCSISDAPRASHLIDPSGRKGEPRGKAPAMALSVL